MITTFINMPLKKTVKPEMIMTIIRNHFEKGFTIEELSNKNGVSSDKIKSWIKKLFNEGEKIFSEEIKSEKEKIKELEKNIKMRDKVLREIFLINK
ncbi:MAG TPA: transposase [Ignavibacteria bacterium]|nr:transposase [Ignavibacteria bacterium]